MQREYEKEYFYYRVILNLTAFAGAVKYDVAAYVWPAYGQKDPSV